MIELLADRIRKARRFARLTQSQAAQQVDVHRGTYGHWERGNGHQPTSTNLLKLAVVLGVGYEWLATGRGPACLAPTEEEVPALRLNCFVQCDEEERLLLALRSLPTRKRSAVLNFALSLVRPWSFAQAAPAPGGGASGQSRGRSPRHPAGLKTEPCAVVRRESRRRPAARPG
jgi:transcriptional regulator with XRE-family HTH domain